MQRLTLASFWCPLFLKEVACKMQIQMHLVLTGCQYKANPWPQRTESLPTEILSLTLSNVGDKEQLPPCDSSHILGMSGVATVGRHLPADAHSEVWGTACWSTAHTDSLKYQPMWPDSLHAQLGGTRAASSGRHRLNILHIRMVYLCGWSKSFLALNLGELWPANLGFWIKASCFDSANQGQKVHSELLSFVVYQLIRICDRKCS